MLSLHALRLPRPRRRVIAAITGVVLAGALSLEAVADDTPIHPGPASIQVTEDRGPGLTASQRFAQFEAKSAQLETQRLAFLDAELRELVAFVAPEGISLERRALWGRLADCESGDWYSGKPGQGTRRWDYGLSFDHGDIFEGGLNFHPRTWDSFRDADMPSHAGKATDIQQMVVGERVLAEQGWKAWPVCSRKLGLR